MIHLTDENFKSEVLHADVPVVVDFWAPWCMPCKRIAPFLEELDKEFAGKVKIGKLNVDESPRYASQYGIMSIPTLAFFKQGKIMGQVMGALSKADLKKKLEEHLL